MDIVRLRGEQHQLQYTTVWKSGKVTEQYHAVLASLLRQLETFSVKPRNVHNATLAHTDTKYTDKTTQLFNYQILNHASRVRNMTPMSISFAFPDITSDYAFLDFYGIT